MIETYPKEMGVLASKMDSDRDPKVLKYADQDAIIFRQLAALGRVHSTRESAYLTAASQIRNSELFDVPGFTFEEYIEIKKKLDQARQTTVMRMPTTEMLRECLKGVGEQQLAIDAVDIEVLNRRWVLHQIRAEISKWSLDFAGSGQWKTDFSATAAKAEGVVSSFISEEVVPNEIELIFPAMNKASYEELVSEGGRNNAVLSLQQKILAIVGLNQVTDRFRASEVRDARGAWSLKIEIQFQSQFLGDVAAQLERRGGYDDLLRAFIQIGLLRDDQDTAPTIEEYVVAWKLVGKYLKVNSGLFLKAKKRDAEVKRSIADAYAILMAPTESGASLMQLLETSPVVKEAVKLCLEQPGMTGLLSRQISRVLGL